MNRAVRVALNLTIFFLILLLGQPRIAPAQEREVLAVTEVVVLGVDHSAQLINQRQQAGALRAFFETARPTAICIERSPERFARSDHYEFTYEIQDVIVPWAREKGLDLCPFDWLPSAEDSALAFGIADLEALPAIRRDSGFQGFLTFPDPASRTAGLFFAERAEERAKHRQFYSAYPAEPAGDAARRLFLYRTFMQAKRVAAAARNFPGKRMLVVVGVMHKDDIEKILASDTRIRIVQPSAIAAEPSAEQVSALTRWQDLAAIASFNLLAPQRRDRPVDLGWMSQVVGELARRRPGVESDLFAAKVAELKGGSADSALATYRRISESSGSASFTWTGVRDRSRLDSFFDPFGNMSIASRALLEAARLYSAKCQYRQAEHIRVRLAQAMQSELKMLQLNEYWARYITPHRASIKSTGTSMIPPSVACRKARH